VVRGLFPFVLDLTTWLKKNRLEVD
jgi:tubulin monoglycylase TTLL3/8